MSASPAAQLKQFRLPDLGEGLTEGEILQWLVAPGDVVTLNQPIVEVETAKAAVEVPSPYAGRVTELHAAAGDTVDVGAPLITFDVGPAGEAALAQDLVPPAAAAVDADDQPDDETPAGEAGIEPGMIGGPAPGGRTSVLVGYGPKQTVAKRRARTPSQSPAVAPPSAERDPAAPKRHSRASARATASAAELRVGRATGAVVVLAKPPVRKLARDLGIDLQAIAGTGPGGVITRRDVQDAATSSGRIRHYLADTPEPADGDGWVAPRDDADDYRIPVKGVRKLTAANVTRSAFTAPHVTEFLAVDVTESMRLLERLSAGREFRGVRLTPLVLVARAVLLAIRRTPIINATWVENAAGTGEPDEIVVLGQVNLGIAAATPRGLLVPNIKDAGRLSLRELADALAALVETAKAGKTQPAEMSGGTFTITNVGVFGVDSGTPILTPGETGILALGAIREMPWVHEGAIAIRQVTQLGLSFDHRVVDGEQGSRFLADIGALLTDPAVALAWS